MPGKIRFTLLGLFFLAAVALTPFRPLKITGRSMEPTLRDGETYVLDLFYWKAGGARRDDVVVIRRDPEQWVKRLVGMPGDRLWVIYHPGGAIARVQNLTVNPSLARLQPTRAQWVEERQVGPGEIFVIGDNLGGSMDSTNPGMGAFRSADIVGVVRTWSLSRHIPYQKHP